MMDVIELIFILRMDKSFINHPMAYSCYPVIYVNINVLIITFLTLFGGRNYISLFLKGKHICNKGF